MQIYRIISEDGREIKLSLVEKPQYPYQEIAKITAINNIRNYRVERINGSG